MKNIRKNYYLGLEKGMGNYRKRKYKRKSGKLKSAVDYLLKISRVNTQALFYGFREANSIADGSGKVVLKTDLVSGNEFPIHLYPLRAIIQGGSVPIGGMKVQSNGYNHTTLGNIEYMGSKGNTIQDGANIKVRQLFCNYHDIKLLLWAEADRKTTFEIMLVKFRSEDMDPALNLVVTDTDVQLRRALMYKLQLIRSLITNPVVKGEVLQGNATAELKILWKKKYTLKETLSTEDQNRHRLVKIFKQCDQIVTFAESPTISLSDVLDADEVVEQLVDDTPTTYPRAHEQVFLVVMGNCHAEDESMSYDINIKSKYTVLAEHTQA